MLEENYESEDSLIKSRNDAIRRGSKLDENISVRAKRVWSLCKSLGMYYPGEEEEIITSLENQLMEQ